MGKSKYGIVVTDPIDNGTEILQVIKVAEKEIPFQPILNENNNETAILSEKKLESKDADWVK